MSQVEFKFARTKKQGTPIIYLDEEEKISKLKLCATSILESIVMLKNPMTLEQIIDETKRDIKNTFPDMLIIMAIGALVSKKFLELTD